METVEVKNESKTSRIKRSYKRQEVYHRWVHSPELCYTNSNYSIKVSGYDNYLFINDYAKSINQFDINNWSWYISNYAIAVIDRDNKKVIVNLNYKTYIHELVYSIPKNYTIYYTNKDITSPTILSTGEEESLLYYHFEALINKFVTDLCGAYYKAINSIGGKTCSKDINLLYSEEETRFPRCESISYNVIVDLAKKYKVKKYSWYKKPFNTEVYPSVYEGFTKHSYDVKLLSLKDFIDKKLFTYKQTVCCAQKYFYSVYCYGFGISYKDVLDNWNTPFDKEYFTKLYKQHNITVDLNNESFNLWQDGIKTIYLSYIKHISNINKANIAQSVINYNNALTEYKKGYEINRLKAWRENNFYASLTGIKYDRWYPSYKKNKLGFWKRVDLLTTTDGFKSTQLKLKDNTVITSRCASVPLNSAIYVWKLVNDIICKYYTENKTNEINVNIRINPKEHKAGIYGVTNVKYELKDTTQNEEIYCWNVVIGCHTLWLDDVVEFINYYNLWDKFHDYGLEYAKNKLT